MRHIVLTTSLLAIASILGRTPALAADDPIRLSQRSPPPAASAPSAPGPGSAPATTSPAPAPQPIRTEIVTHDNWTVNCSDFADKRRVCSATLQLLQNGTNQVVFAWVMGKNADGKVLSILQTPTGIAIGPGVEIKPTKGSARKAAYVNCEAARCEAALEMEDGFARDAAASDTVDATIFGTSGQGVKFTLPFKGFDKALAAVR